MTFILTTRTKDGVILSADSKEVIQGGYLLWEDFAILLKQKNEEDDSLKQCISPNEITELIQSRSKLTNGRIKSFDGAKKIFKITNHFGLLIAGKANPGGQEFSQTISEIQSSITDAKTNDIDQIVDIVFQKLNSLFLTDGDDKLDSEHILCGYDEKTATFRLFKLYFDNKFIPDGNGGFLKDADGNTIKEKVLYKREDNQVLLTGGLTNCIRELSEFNSKNANLNLEQAFNLSKQILNLAVTIESYTEQIPAIGGQLYYAMITKNGFKWLSENENILNQFD